MKDDPVGREVLHQASVEVGMKTDAYFTAATPAEFLNYRRFYETAPPNLR